MDGKLRITMEGYISDIINHYGITKSAKSPATAELLLIDPNSQPLDYEYAKAFHSSVAKLLF